jgi:hypothetical protein
MLLQGGYRKMKYSPKIGAFVLETLTTGMYTNPFDSIREYIQNASDSIFAAEKENLLNKNKGKITITVNPAERSLSIYDNGMGIPSEDALSRLLNIGMSDKEYGKQAGFRGIGRLAGIAYCSKLSFITSKVNENKATKITIDCDGIRRYISPALKQIEELADVVQKNHTHESYNAKSEDHFFEVKLEGIFTNNSDFLDNKKLEEYLSHVAPVEYDCLRFTLAPKIFEWAKRNNIDIPFVKLIIKTPDMPDGREVFKPFKPNYRTKKNDYDLQIKDILFYPDNNMEEPLFWMWYSKNDLVGMFDDDKVAGLRFRKNNIEIGGPERVSELFPGNEGRLNYWMIGEIHVLSNEIIPNARRDGFESTDMWHQLKRQLEPFIRKHCKDCHENSASATRPTQKVIANAQAVLNEASKTLNVGLSSYEEKNTLVDKVAKEADRVRAALENRKQENEKADVKKVLDELEEIKTKIDNQNNYTIQRLRSNLDRKQKKILIEVLSIINSTLNNVSCSKSKTCLDAIKSDILNKYQITESDNK